MRHIICLALLALLAACDRPLIEGIVVNVQGETVPGVAVRVIGTEYSALTNNLGEYAVPFPVGEVELAFDKSGYTTGRLTLTAAAREPIRAEIIEMRRLPASAGVYLFDNFRYRRTTGIEPKKYFLEDSTPVFGTERAPELRIDDLEPVILTYQMPRYDARITRLTRNPAKRTASTEEITEIWSESGTIRPEVTTVTEDSVELLELLLDQPLEPGVYAIHYGALEGYSILDSRIHTFRVGPPELLEEEPSEEGEGEETADGESE